MYYVTETVKKGRERPVKPDHAIFGESESNSVNRSEPVKPKFTSLAAKTMMSGAVDSSRGRHATLANGLCTWIINAKHGQGFAVSGSKSMLLNEFNARSTYEQNDFQFLVIKYWEMLNLWPVKVLKIYSKQIRFYQTNIKLSRYVTIHLFFLQRIIYFLIMSEVKVTKLYRPISYCFCSLILKKRRIFWII